MGADSGALVAGEPHRPRHEDDGRRNDARRARDLLLEWGAVRLDEAPSTLGNLAAAVSGDLAATIMELERSLYGRGTPQWDGGALKTALAKLDAVTRTPEQSSDEGLLPLYR